jgi:hypothetical protein
MRSSFRLGAPMRVTNTGEVRSIPLRVSFLPQPQLAAMTQGSFPAMKKPLKRTAPRRKTIAKSLKHRTLQSLQFFWAYSRG